jgi:hypothetical protein
MKELKQWLVLLWLLVPVGLVSYHFGPGQRELAWCEAAALRATAAQHEQSQHWEPAIAAYGEALSAVPSFGDEASAGTLARDQLRLAQIRASFQLGKLDQTLTDAQQFVEQVEATHGPDSPLVYDARDFLGRVHYQAMIALRLESAEKQVWMKHWELSRQNFRFLAEHSPPSRNDLDRKNLEVVIKSANLPTPPPPPAAGAGVPLPDNRFRAPTENTTEVTPPEFELGS